MESNEQNEGTAVPVMPTMDREGFEAQVKILGDIVGSYREAKGTVSQRRTAATLEALALPIGVDPSLPTDLTEHSTLGDLASFVEDLASWADGLRDSMVSAVMSAQSQSADEVAALKERYDAQRTLVQSLSTVLAAMGIDVTDVEVPVLRSSGGGGGGRKAGSKGMTFYRIVNGVRKNQSENQDSLSSFAFYHGAKITGSKASGNHTGHLTSWLEANVKNDGDKFSLGKPWSVEVDGVTYAMDVIDPASSDDEQADSDSDD
jgi:hypothetical protein